MRASLVAATLLVLGGCRAAATHVAKPTPMALASPSPTATPALPRGVVAEQKGEYGLVRVEERDGLRLMTPRYTRGVLAKYAKLVSSASLGAVTD